MNRIIFFWSSVVFCCLPGLSCRSQQLEVNYVELAGNKLVLHYDLLDTIAERFFTVRLYSSADNYLNPLTKIQGDAGLEVKPGQDKKIVWDARGELGDAFEGNVALEVRARIFIPFINLQQVNQYKVFKRKRQYDLTWSGGSPQNILNFDLFRDDRKVMTFPNIANVGHHQLEFPVYIKPGGNYHFRVSDTKNKDEVVNTGAFRVKRKVPLLVKVLPAAVVAVALKILLSKQEADPIGLPPDIDNVH